MDDLIPAEQGARLSVRWGLSPPIPLLGIVLELCVWGGGGCSIDHRTPRRAQHEAAQRGQECWAVPAGTQHTWGQRGDTRGTEHLF